MEMQLKIVVVWIALLVATFVNMAQQNAEVSCLKKGIMSPRCCWYFIVTAVYLWLVTVSVAQNATKAGLHLITDDRRRSPVIRAAIDSGIMARSVARICLCGGAREAKVDQTIEMHLLIASWAVYSGVHSVWLPSGRHAKVVKNLHQAAKVQKLKSMKPKIWNKIFSRRKRVNIFEIRTKIQCRGSGDMLGFPWKLWNLCHQKCDFQCFGQTAPKTTIVRQYAAYCRNPRRRSSAKLNPTWNAA